MIIIATEASNRAAAQRKAEGKTLTQDEERDLNTAVNQAGSEGKALKRILGGGKA